MAKWSRIVNNGSLVTRRIGGSAFLKTIYALMKWNSSYKYRVRGKRMRKGDDAVLLFDLNDTEIFIPKIILDEKGIGNFASKIGKSIIAFPSAWADGFGSSFYCRIGEKELAEKPFSTTENTIPFSDMQNLDITAPEEAAEK